MRFRVYLIEIEASPFTASAFRAVIEYGGFDATDPEPGPDGVSESLFVTVPLGLSEEHFLEVIRKIASEPPFKDTVSLRSIEDVGLVVERENLLNALRRQFHDQSRKLEEIKRLLG